MLIEQYEKAIASGHIRNDAQQRQVLGSMQRLNNELLDRHSSWFSRFCSHAPIQGIYLFGPVGVGKTYLMDLFYETVKEPKKARFHFHHFMQQIDAQLRLRQGQKDPLKRIAADLAKNIRLLCFDEFLVHDVAHAMILAELLQALLAKGMVLVITGNTAPDDLYPNGVQRQRFLPAINVLKKQCEVIGLSCVKDYRIGRQIEMKTYLEPLNASNNRILLNQFASLSNHVEENGVLCIQNREIPFIRCSKLAVWFDFNVICNLPRSQLDYLEIADRFDTIFVSDIPQLSANNTVPVILLIHLVDVLYDRGIKLILSAAVPLEELYVEGEMQKEYQRTYSRLQEMQAADYFSRHPWRHEQDLLSLLDCD